MGAPRLSWWRGAALGAALPCLVLLALAVTADTQWGQRRQTTQLAFAVSGSLENFAPSRFPGGVLQGSYFAAGPACAAPPCVQVGPAAPRAANAIPAAAGGPVPHPVVTAPGVFAAPGAGILVAGDGVQDDPVDEIRFTQAKNNLAAAELSTVPTDLRKIDLALDHSDRVKQELDDKIAQIRQSNRELEATLHSILQAPDRIGLPGPPGMRGLPGRRGPPGAPGKAVPGPRGIRGPPGKVGLRGVRGPMGKAGPPGAPGPQGNPGAPGSNGLQGLPGINSKIVGPPGVMGAPGVDGAQGPKGSQGLHGMNGIPGPDGRPGKMGKPGATGAPGAPGADGPTGKQGVVGQPGPRGPQGSPGKQGQAGDVGFPGPPGPPGLAGEMGQRGPRGPAGARGAAGQTYQMRPATGTQQLASEGGREGTMRAAAVQARLQRLREMHGSPAAGTGGGVSAHHAYRRQSGVGGDRHGGGVSTPTVTSAALANARVPARDTVVFQETAHRGVLVSGLKV